MLMGTWNENIVRYIGDMKEKTLLVHDSIMDYLSLMKSGKKKMSISNTEIRLQWLDCEP